jgi:adenosyl cobinamide kinase/adenosyl cobinamide phosphate guanylyltransferase
MAVIKKSEQMLTYVTPAEKRDIDESVERHEVSRAEWIRQACMEKLEQERQALDDLKAAGDFVIVDAGGHTVRDAVEPAPVVKSGTLGWTTSLG